MQTTTYATLKLARALGCNRFAGNAGVPVAVVAEFVREFSADDAQTVAEAAADRLHDFGILSDNDHAICREILSL